MKQLKINKSHFKWCLNIILLFFSIVSCVSETRFTKFKYNSIESQANLLKKYYQQVLTSTGKKRAKYEKLFFDAFPSSFVNYLRLYGYGYKKEPALLWTEHALLYDEVYKEDGYGHIQLFYDLKCINKELYYNKYIDIYIGGWWGADAIGDFGLYGKLMEDTEECATILLKRSREELLSVFYFMFDKPHPEPIRSNSAYKDLYEKVAKFSAELAEIIQTAYELVLHHHSFFVD